MVSGPAWILIIPAFFVLLAIQVPLYLNQKKFREIVKNERIHNYKPWLPALFGIDENDMSEVCRKQKKKILDIYFYSVAFVMVILVLILSLNLILN